MKRSKVLTLLLTLMAALMLLSTSVLATDANGDGYHDGDVATIREIIKNSDWLSEHYDINDPADWTELKGGNNGFVVWFAEVTGEPMRVTNLDISSSEDVAIRFSGPLDVSGLTQMHTLWCYDNPGISSIKLPEGNVLDYLDCDGTGITAIDVSKNPGLSMLYVHNTGITDLDVSKNPELEYLSCFGTGITKLDVSKNPALVELRCSETGITKLDVSKNPVLAWLMCDDTAISELDVTKNPALEYLSCSGTGITKLDVSKNPALVDLSCVYTGITKLDVSKNPALENLYCYKTGITELDVSKNPALTNLNCDDTAISELDLSQNPEMEYLDADDVPLTKLVTSFGTLNLQQTEGGLLELDYFDFIAATAYLDDETKAAYGHDGWKGLPAGAEEDGTAVSFVLSGNVTVSAVRHKHNYVLRVEDSSHVIECVICEDWYELGECPGEDYTDLDMSKWYHPYTDNVLWAGYMQGSSNTVFAPNDTLSRAMLAQILYNMEGKPQVSGKDDFADTKDGSWYTAAILWASQNEIVNGYGNGTFGPNDPVTREQMVTMFCRYAKLKDYDLTKGSIDGFSDADEVSSFALDAMKWAVGKGLINGVGGNRLSPLGQSSRAEAAAVITRFVEKIAD